MKEGFNSHDKYCNGFAQRTRAKLRLLQQK